jgi:hypothetical protein
MAVVPDSLAYSRIVSTAQYMWMSTQQKSKTVSVPAETRKWGVYPYHGTPLKEEEGGENNLSLGRWGILIQFWQCTWDNLTNYMIFTHFTPLFYKDEKCVNSGSVKEKYRNTPLSTGRYEDFFYLLKIAYRGMFQHRSRYQIYFQ